MGLLSGPVVFIDDEILQPETPACLLLEAIRASGRPVVAAEALPDEEIRKQWFEHWQTLAFVVIDWDLSPGSNGAMGSSTLSRYERIKLFAFLSEVMATIYCPIFIISREDTRDIERQIAEQSQLTDDFGGIDKRITVFPKDVLMDDIVGHLTSQVQTSPALSVLRTWEQEFDAAKNRLFIDFNEIEPDWPVFVWQMAKKDSVDPAFELSSVISSNLLSRVNPVAFDDNIVNIDEGEPFYGTAMRKVSQGRTFIPNDRLSSRMVFPGDLFDLDASNDLTEVWINVSPVCQTVARQGKDGEPERPIMLHLIRGVRKPVTSKSKFNELIGAGKGPTGELVHTLLEETPYYFEFGVAQIRKWADIRDFRIGRLLSPYVTRFQQKHSAYLQSEGLPRVSYELYCDPEPEA